MTRKSIIMFYALCLLANVSLAQQKVNNDFAVLIDQIKKSVVFFGIPTQDGEPNYFGTGFLVDIHNIHHLVTAKHVITDPSIQPYISQMRVYFNLKNGNYYSRSIDSIKTNLSVDWIFHDNTNVDVAIIPFPIEPQDDVKIIPDSLFSTKDRLFELYDVFFLSYQQYLGIQKRVTPIIRHGTISLINDDNTFIIDGFVFPGNSGSPVFLKPSPIRFDRGGLYIGTEGLDIRLIGIIVGYKYYPTPVPVPSLNEKINFPYNTGLSVVHSVSYIKEIVESDAFKKQLDRLIKSMNKQKQ